MSSKTNDANSSKSYIPCLQIESFHEKSSFPLFCTRKRLSCSKNQKKMMAVWDLVLRTDKNDWRTNKWTKMGSWGLSASPNAIIQNHSLNHTSWGYITSWLQCDLPYHYDFLQFCAVCSWIHRQQQQIICTKSKNMNRKKNCCQSQINWSTNKRALLDL